MIRRLRDEGGFGLIELMIATTILVVALLGLAAGYDQAFLSLHRASTKSVATELADKQLELWRSLQYASIGLDQATYASLTTVGGGGYDAACGSTPQCSPIQTVTGSDGRSYRLESFVRNVPESVTGVSWAEIVATVIVRDPGQTGSPEIVRETSAYDRSNG